MIDENADGMSPFNVPLLAPNAVLDTGVVRLHAAPDEDSLEAVRARDGFSEGVLDTGGTAPPPAASLAATLSLHDGFPPTIGGR